MRIRTQLLLLVVAAIVPMVLLAVALMRQVWDLQHEAWRRQIAERVTAVRVALDVETTGTIRTLEALVTPGPADAHALGDTVATRLARMLPGHVLWSTAGVARADGTLAFRRDAGQLPDAVRPDMATIRAAIATHRPAVSNLVPVPGTALLMTYVAVPIEPNPPAASVLYAGIEHAAWLAILRQVPIDPQATLTLTDRTSIVIARTRGDERWAGKPTPEAYRRQIESNDQGSFETIGVDGERYTSAFSRLRTSQWTVGTGVPRHLVDAAVQRHAVALGVGSVLALAIALLAALMLARRISGGLTGLAAAADHVGSAGGAAPGGTAPLGIQEADVVRRALARAAEMLQARERSLQQAVAAAEKASQSKDEFIAMLGHELRNPLSAIRNATAIIDSPRKTPEMAENARAILRRQIGYLSGMVDDLLDIARLTSGKVVLHRTDLDLAEIVEQVLAEFARSGRSAHLQVHAQLVPALVHADETRLAQVVSNLVDNACKYTPRGGRLDVTLRARETDVELQVRDSGVGIPVESLDTVFDPFAQVRGSMQHAQGGLGLGLAVVRRLVVLHEGTVRADSGGPGQGACFIVTLPRAAAGVPAPAPAALAPVNELPPRRVVVVDDLVDNRESIALLLELKGHEVHLAATGPDGVATIARERPDVALVDIGLPGFDGCEVARRVRAQPDLAATRLIALTGYGDEADRVRALQAGFDEFIVKPFSFEAFLRAALDDAAPARA